MYTVHLFTVKTNILDLHFCTIVIVLGNRKNVNKISHIPFPEEDNFSYITHYQACMKQTLHLLPVLGHETSKFNVFTIIGLKNYNSESNPSQFTSFIHKAHLHSIRWKGVSLTQAMQGKTSSPAWSGDEADSLATVATTEGLLHKSCRPSNIV